MGSQKTRTLDDGITVLDVGYRNSIPVALVVKKYEKYDDEYIIGFNYEIKDNKINWGYGYYYGTNIEKAKNDFQEVLAGKNIAYTFNQENKTKREVDIEMSIDLAQEKLNRIKNRVIKAYNLDEKEVKDFEMAIINYDYEANEGTIITKREDIVNLYRDIDTEEKFKVTQKQITALAEYIKETEDLYTFYGFYEETDKVLNSIFNEMKELKKKNIERGR